MIVVDASALLEVLLQTAAAKRVSTRIFAPGETVCAPHLLDMEVTQVLRRYVRSGAIDTGRAAEAIRDAWRAGAPVKKPVDPPTPRDRKSTRLNSSHITRSRMPSSA